MSQIYTNPPSKATPIILTVTQITKAIRSFLESTFGSLMVKGEVSNLKVQASGHVYFSLKDDVAQISCVMFQMDARRLKTPLKMGDKITVRGELTVYEARGNYQIIVREINLDGLGEQLLRLEELKQKLKALGYFDLERKKPLPHLPSRIGVVTSETGAVIRDIIHVLTRRLGGFHLILNPVRVQGEGAAEEIAHAIYQFNQYKLADVLIVGRGGGSFEELSCFNDERVAKAIFESEIPIVSAVGHETDITISDLVADVRAPTPSAAAEIISKEKVTLLEALSKHQKALYIRGKQRLQHERERLEWCLKHPLFTTRDFLTQSHAVRIDDMKEELEKALQNVIKDKKVHFFNMQRTLATTRPAVKIELNRKRLEEFERACLIAMRTKLDRSKKNLSGARMMIDAAMGNKMQTLQKLYKAKKYDQEIPIRLLALVSRFKNNLSRQARHLEAVNPKNVLKRGYSIVFSKKDNAVISSIDALQRGDQVTIQLLDGKASAQVLSSEKDG